MMNISDDDFDIIDDEVINWSPNELKMLKYMLENDGMQFMRYFFKFRENSKMIRNWHHYVIEYILQAVLDGKINRLIINLAPGYTKTEQVVINFITRGLALNPEAKFIHTSYSGDLALENSAAIRENILSEQFQQLWPMKIKVDKRGKKRWFNEVGGGMMAAPSGGQIIGFRAGRMKTGFTGAFIIDDPLKANDANSMANRENINKGFHQTMRSRLALESVPMIVNMQRLDDDDLSGFLLKGGSGDRWHHLLLPTLLDENELNLPYPKDHTYGIPININEVLDAMKTGIPYAF